MALKNYGIKAQLSKYEEYFLLLTEQNRSANTTSRILSLPDRDQSPALWPTA